MQFQADETSAGAGQGFWDVLATPPSCWGVLMSPEARPASCSATPAGAAIDTGTKADAGPVHDRYATAFQNADVVAAAAYLDRP